MQYIQLVPKRDYLSFERTSRPEEVQENPPEQIEKLEHPAFIARFGRSDQVDGICGKDNRLDQDIERMQAAMAKASRIVLDGFELRTDVNVIRYPDRYQDRRGAVMWDRVTRLISHYEAIKRAVA